MGRFFAGAGAMLLAMAAAFFIWKSNAEAEQIIPAAPAGAFVAPLKETPSAAPPAASEETKEEKRFARADKDEDGRITRAELLEPRRKPFAKLDANGDGRLSFEEWAVKTSEKFAKADGDGNGALTAAEFATTKAKSPQSKRCAC